MLEILREIKKEESEKIENEIPLFSLPASHISIMSRRPQFGLAARTAAQAILRKSAAQVTQFHWKSR